MPLLVSLALLSVPMLVSLARTRAPLLLTVLALGAVLTGCGGGPTQAGAAVVVGSRAVSLSETQGRVDAALARPDVMGQATQEGLNAADLARIVVTYQVQHLLLSEAAGREGITVDDKLVDAELAKPGTADRLVNKLALDPESAREAVRDELVAQALTTKYLNRLSVTVDTTAATSRAEAIAKARQLAAGPAQADALLAADGRTAQRGKRLRAAELPQQAALYVFGTPAGQVVALPVSPSPEVWRITRVTRRDIDPAPPPGDPAATSLAQLSEETIDLIGRRLTQPLSEEIGVRVNPRFGTWDPIFLFVIPPGQEPNLVLPAALS